MPEAPPVPMRAVISNMQFVGTSRTEYSPNEKIPPLAYSENSFVANFMVTGTPVGVPVNFEVNLAGVGDEWVSTGSGGSAVFNRLKEGEYTLRVRPRMGEAIGVETSLAFTVEPPWFRTYWAYSAYGLSIVCIVLVVAWVMSLLDRREKLRLAHLVDERTSEVNQTNSRLALQVDQTMRRAAELRESEERYRNLSQELEKRVKERTSELNNANEKLTASNRELEAFSYSVSHDLRAPLRNIRGFAELLEKRSAGRLDLEGTRFLQTVSAESTRLSELIDSLLSFSRLSRTKLQFVELDMDAIVQAVLAVFAAEGAGRNIEWKIGSLPAARGDPTLARLVVSNLVGNALKFSRTREKAVIEIGFLPDGSEGAGNAFFVKDNGVGFDQKYAAKLFGVFQRLHSAKQFEGTGIGLATVRRIVNRHGGRIWANGVVDEGAEFCFSLPLFRAP
jgi:signal transduction histidine kinase